MLKKSSLSFLQNLKENNNRDWFAANKHLYADALEDYKDLITRLIPSINLFDASIGSLEASDCIFRIYRDVRFSANKEPYKTHFGAYLALGGRQSKLAGYYIHIEPEASFLSGGIYMADTATMRRLRNEMVALSDEYKEIVEGEGFRSIFTSLGDEKLKRVPNGFDPNCSVAEYLKLKHISPIMPLTDDEILSDGFKDATIKAFSILAPLVKFINEAIGDEP